MRPSKKTARLLAAAATDNATIGFDSPVVLDKVIGLNNRAGIVYLKLYQLNANLAVPTNGFTPALTLPLPASSAFELDINLEFPFGMGYRIVTGVADNDGTAVALNDILGLNFLAA